MASEYPRSLTREEFERAIWLDFEGGRNHPPTFAGYLIGDNYDIDIVDSEFFCLSESPHELGCRELDQFREWLVEKALVEDRVIIGYSEHEFNIITEDDYYKEPMEELYRNANLLTKSYFKRNRRTTFRRLNDVARNEGRRVSLKDYLKLDYVGYEYPDDLGDFRPSSAIGNLVSQCRRRGRYSMISEQSKERLDTLVTYNEHDCRGMKHLIEYIFSRNRSIDELSH
ncbi:MAG: hypothetical protein QF722_01075 [Candidatus Thalassarchaeaceae archaeon]|nr:hypothetical protein [Candidatus Thalassarchaeaceae archaeon]